MKCRRIELYEFRSLYLAGGPNAASLLDENHYLAKVNSNSIIDVSSRESIVSLAETNINFIISPFDLGFPPEEAKEQKKWFEKLVSTASEFGIETLALITPSAFMPRGSFKKNSWTAKSPKGKPIYYSQSSNRLMTCWTSDDWTEHLEKLISECTSTGASGIVMDSIYFGAMPLFLDGEFEGAAGCHCARCQKLFATHMTSKNINVKRIPPTIKSDNVISVDYISWRASIVTQKLALYKSLLNHISEDLLFGVASAHFAYRPSHVMTGLDPEWALYEPDICILEHHRAPTLKKEGLFYESPGQKVIFASAGKTLTASLTYPFGPEEDKVMHEARFSSLISGSFSSGVSPVIRAGEYRDSNVSIGCYLSNESYILQRETIAGLFNWLDKNPDIYEDSVPVSRIGILFSWERMKWNAHPFAASFYTILQTLTEIQIPLKVIINEKIKTEDIADINVLIIPEAGTFTDDESYIIKDMFSGKTFIYSGDGAEWLEGTNSFKIDIDSSATNNKKHILDIKQRILKSIYRNGTGLFGGFPISQRSGLPPLLSAEMNSMNYHHLPKPDWNVLHDAVCEARKNHAEDLVIEGPPYIHVSEWKKTPNAFFHITNIIPEFPGPNQISLRFASPVNARIVNPMSNKIIYLRNENSIIVKPEPYLVIEIKDRYPTTNQ